MLCGTLRLVRAALTPHCSILGVASHGAAHRGVASCCGCCWGDERAVPDVSAAWPDSPRQRNAQTLDQTQLKEREREMC